MSELQLYEIINPSDPITVLASPDHAAILATILRCSLLFLNPVGCKESLPSMPSDAFKARRDRMDTDEADLRAYAAVFHSATIGRPEKRSQIDELVSEQPEAERLAKRRAINEANRTSLNDIAGKMHQIGDGLMANLDSGRR